MQWVAAIFRNDGGPMLRSFRSTSYAQSAVVIRSTHIAIDVGRVNSMNVPSSSSYEVPDFQQCIRIWSMFRSWTKAMTRNSSSARASNKTASPWFGILIVSFFFLSSLDRFEYSSKQKWRMKTSKYTCFCLLLEQSHCLTLFCSIYFDDSLSQSNCLVGIECKQKQKTRQNLKSAIEITSTAFEYWRCRSAFYKKKLTKKRKNLITIYIRRRIKIFRYPFMWARINVRMDIVRSRPSENSGPGSQEDKLRSHLIYDLSQGHISIL